MSDTLSLTKDALKPLAHQFRNYERLLELELRGLTVESRYELNFSRLVKPDPFRLFEVEASGDLPLMLGTDQRDYLVPALAKCLKSLRSGALVLDVGSGDGQTTAAALTNRSSPLSLIPLDPADGAIARYQGLFNSQFAQISVPRTIVAGIDELLAAAPGHDAAVDENLDMIMAIHALYFTENQTEFLRFAHDRLKPGGTMVIVFAECDGRYSGRLSADYWKSHPAAVNEDHHTGGDDLDRFFGVADQQAGRDECEASLRDSLGGDHFRVVNMARQPTRLFGHDLGDMIAAGFLTSLAASNDEQLKDQIRFVSNQLQEDPETFDLQLTLTGPRARMFSVAQPQIFIELQKQ